ncbi:MAG: tandem-95 repeat protein [Verrucomicrobiota bacterium]
MKSITKAISLRAMLGWVSVFGLIAPAALAAPVISAIPNQDIAEDSSTAAIPFTITGFTTRAPAVTGSSDNTKLVANSGIVIGGSGGSRTVTVTPLSDQSGSATITITVTDPAGTDTETFVVTVRAVNDPPTIGQIGDQGISEDQTLGPIAFTVDDIDTAAGQLTINTSSSNQSLVPASAISIGGAGTARTITVTPAPNQSGSTVIGLVVSDGSLTATTRFSLKVDPVNDPPVISDVTDQTVGENGQIGPLGFSVSDPETSGPNLAVTGTSSNTKLIPDGNIVIGTAATTGNGRTVTVTPSPNQSGTAVITLRVSDGVASATDTFTVTVNPSNRAPVVSTFSDQSTPEDTALGPISFTVDDPDSGPANLTVALRSSNQSLVPDTNLTSGGSGGGRTLTATPAPNASGSTVITVTVSDGRLSTSDDFVLSVTAVNDAPTISSIETQSTLEDTPTAPSAFTVGDIDSPVGSLTLSAETTNPSLIPVSGVSFGGTDASRTVTVTPAFNQSGTATITVIVSDGQASASTQFRVSVAPVNDPPVISSISNQSVPAGSSTGAIAFSVDDPDTDPAKLTLSASSSNPGLVPLTAISFGGGGVNRTVTVTPAGGNENGSSLIGITVSDGDRSAVATFTVSVTAVTEAPKIVTPPQNTTVDEGGTASFVVAATGTAPLFYQWFFNGQEISGADSASYVVRNVQAIQEGAYSVRVSNSAGTVTSPPATLAVQRFDYGDAPESVLAVLYHTTLASKGPRHRIISGFFLGQRVDAEKDGQPSADALGDDSNPAGAADDEDGVVFASGFIPGKQATLIVTASAQGVLDGWFDLNRAGGFEASEHLINHVGLAPGPNTLTVNIPANANVGDTFARFRFSRSGVESPDDLSPAPDGEVEDYRITVAENVVPLDFGDAPDVTPGTTGGLGYPTLLSNNGARHIIVQGFFLGKSVDPEANGQPNVDATGDDLNPQSVDDEDGVEFVSALTAGKAAQIVVTASQPGRLDAWIDFNRNRSWADPGEQIFASAALAAGANPLAITVPASAQGGRTYARFRFSKDGKLSFTGQAPEGEVEDYIVTIDSGSPCDQNYKGTDFWLTFPGNYPQNPAAPLRLTLCIVGTQGTTGTVEIAGLRFSQSFTLPASMSTGVTLPDAASLGDVVDVVQRKGIHVVANGPVAVYGLSRIPYSSDGFLGLPTPVLGQEYLVMSYPNVFSEVSALNGSQFGLVATVDDTVVTIVPSRDVLGHPKGVPFVVELDQGQTYQLRDPDDATADLSGTEVVSDKPVAVFGGHQCANINSPSRLFCDYLVEQLLPTTAWGKVFYTMPLSTRVGGDTFRILARADNTQIAVNGAPIGTLDRGQVRTLNLAAAARVTADKAVYVAQFANSSDYDGVKNADPFMVTVPPTRFYSRDHMICTAPNTFSNHFVNVVAPTSVVGALTLDGAPVPAGAYAAIGASGFSLARLPVSAGQHTLSAAQPFGTIVYGFGLYESYAWPGGLLFGDITPPSITCPNDFTVALGGPNSPAGATLCKALVPDLRPQVEVADNCRLPSERFVTQIPPPGTPVDAGVYPITLTATDEAGNDATCAVTMTVVDQGTPAIACPRDLVARCTKGTGANVVYLVEAKTPCGTPAEVECIPPPGSFFPNGTTTVVCTVKGFPKQTCTFKVTVQCDALANGGVVRPKPLSLTWEPGSVLEVAPSVHGPWTPLPAATQPFSPAHTENEQFFRIRN